MTTPKYCAYAKICKGCCTNPDSCIKATKTEDEYWDEIQKAMRIKDRLELVKHYLNSNIKTPNINTILKIMGINLKTNGIR